MLYCNLFGGVESIIQLCVSCPCMVALKGFSPELEMKQTYHYPEGLVFSGYDFFSAVDDAWLRVVDRELCSFLPCKGCVLVFVGGVERADSYRFHLPNMAVWNRPIMFNRPNLSTRWAERCHQPNPKSRRFFSGISGNPWVFLRKRRYDSSPRC